jgi:hypothetical protein
MGLFDGHLGATDVFSGGEVSGANAFALASNEAADFMYGELGVFGDASPRMRYSLQDELFA